MKSSAICISGPVKKIINNMRHLQSSPMTVWRSGVKRTQKWVDSIQLPTYAYFQDGGYVQYIGRIVKISVNTAVEKEFIPIEHRKDATLYRTIFYLDKIEKTSPISISKLRTVGDEKVNPQGVPRVSEYHGLVFKQETQVFEDGQYCDERAAKEMSEGSKKQIFVNIYERNEKARKDCLNYFKCSCSVCGLNFEDRYGFIGKDFIHVHHLVPISKIGKEYKINPIEDLIPVCPNCHAMLHRRTPPFAIDELKQIIKNNIPPSP